MKITFVLKNWLGSAGGVRVISIYANLLSKRGHQVSVVSPAIPKPNLRRRIKSFFLNKGLPSKKTKQTSYFKDTDATCITVRERSFVSDRDIPDADIVVAAWWETAEWVAKLSKPKGEKAYFIQHHEVHDYLPKERVEATYKLPLHKIVISQWLVDIMNYQYKDSNVSLVPNSVDPKQFFALPRCKQSIPTVGMMYSQTHWKGADISLKAFSLAAKKIKNLRLVAFGQKKPLDDVLPPNTEFILQPPQNEIKDIYAKCDMWLFASRVEGFGLPILEAMACRTPVIGTPAGAIPQLLADGGGIIVKSEDPEDMAKAIVKINAFSNSEWKLMSETAYTRATSYSWEDATDLFEAALATALKSYK